MTKPMQAHRYTRRSKCMPQGYTLIEILVVMLIISIVTSVALLSIGHNENREIETFANEISQMVTLAEDQAMLEPNILGLSISGRALQFASYQTADDKQKNHWVPLQDAVLGERVIPSNIEVRVETGGVKTAMSANTLNPQVVISTNGDTTPFTIYVGKKGQKPLYAITGDADGKVTTRFLS